MKKFVILFIFFVFLFSNNVNREVLFIESKLFPKMMMLIKNLENKNQIKVAIISNNNTLQTAKILKKFMENSKIKINIIKKINLDYDVYILTYSLKQVEFNKLISNKKIIFSILPDEINQSMFSIYIGAKLHPYINPYLIKKADIQIEPIIFKVGKIYE